MQDQIVLSLSYSSFCYETNILIDAQACALLTEFLSSVSELDAGLRWALDFQV